jgi:membrane fusion protein, copper/silver efflux system
MKKLTQPLLVLLVLSLCSCNWVKKVQTHDPVERVDASTIRVYKEALENLKVGKANQEPFPDLLSLMGKISVTEDRTTIVPARVTGRIENIFFASGEHVNQGQILATMFSPDFIAAREEYLLSLKQANSGSADPSDFSNLAQMSRKKLETMGLNAVDIGALPNNSMSDPQKILLNVRAPRSGVLIQKSAVLGNLNNVGDTLFIIGDLSKVWFSGDIYPEDLPKVHVGQDVFINAVGVEKPLYGKVSFISPLVDPNTRSIKIRAAMENPNKALKMDEYVQGNVVLENKTELVVPTEAIVRTPEGPVIFKHIGHIPNDVSLDNLDAKKLENFVDSMDFKKVAVRVGNEQNGMTAIVTGVNAGDEIVSDGGWLLDAALNANQ